ncbi:MAG: sulfur carrier protein ThiS [Candidatus Margulisiibacteriota bacterium]
MNLKINGENEALEVNDLTISTLLKLKEVKMPEMVSVELNGDIIDREVFESTSVSDGDEVEFLYFMGGGQ